MTRKKQKGDTLTDVSTAMPNLRRNTKFWCVFTIAKIRYFFETSKLFYIFFKSFPHKLFQITQTRNLDYRQKMPSLVANIDYAFKKQSNLPGQFLVLALCCFKLYSLIFQRGYLLQLSLCLLQFCFLGSKSRRKFFHTSLRSSIFSSTLRS